MMNRRSFLAAAAAAAFAPATFVRADEGRRRVVIVGAGLAGLSSAYELRKLGFEVVVLEGQGRAGGRVQTQANGIACVWKHLSRSLQDVFTHGAAPGGESWFPQFTEAIDTDCRALL